MGGKRLIAYYDGTMVYDGIRFIQVYFGALKFYFIEGGALFHSTKCFLTEIYLWMEWWERYTLEWIKRESRGWKGMGSESVAICRWYCSSGRIGTTTAVLNEGIWLSVWKVSSFFQPKFFSDEGFLGRVCPNHGQTDPRPSKTSFEKMCT